VSSLLVKGRERLTDSGSGSVHQLYRGSVENAAGRDVVIHENGGRLLTRGESAELHKLVQRLADEFGQDGRATWLNIHKIIGVDSVKEMRLEQYQPTRAVLTLMLEKAMLSRQLSNSAASDLASLKSKLQTVEAEKIRLAQRLTAQCQPSTELLEAKNAAIHWHNKFQSADAERNSLVQRLTASEQLQKIEVSHLQDELLRSRSDLTVAKKHSSSKRWQLIALASTVGLICMAAWHWQQKEKYFSYMLYQQSLLTVCQYRGESYSWGTRLNLPDGRIKCVKSKNGQYMWQADR
jgi:hypothetical protein